MTLKILQLKAKWNKEKNSYKIQEIGSGVQKFVKDVLQSEEIFNLNVGLKSTPLERRKYEFLEEEKTKGARHADIVIYITPEIIIPVEIEKYQNIEAGKNQLLQYQLDLEKKYGILTDGYIWRFYNNNIYRKFNLEQIFGETDTFLEFWKEYIKPEFYYLSFFEPQGQLPLIEEVRLPVESNRQIFFEDITKLIRSFKNKLNIEGYFKDLEKKEREKKAVEITYAYIIQFILYKTLVDNEFDDFPREYKEKCQKIHEHIRASRYKDILGMIESISAGISKNIYRPFAKEQEFIRQKLHELYMVENELSDVSPWLDIFVFIKKYSFQNIHNEIFGYIYENYLKELFEETKKGQYFTDPAVVNFMIEQIGYTPENIKKITEKDKDSISLVDPACGSGTFIYSATDSIINAFGSDTLSASKQIEKIVTNNIFGLDIAEFPLYLAEMNILMRMLPLIISKKYNNPIEKKIKVFKTRDSIAEFMDTSLRNTLSDINVEYERTKGQIGLFTKELHLGYSSYIRDEDDLKEMKGSLENQPRCPRRRFDYVIANPPYVSYNECCKQGILIFDLIKQRKVKLNNIYGVNLHSVPDNRKKYRPNPNLYAFFIAVGLALLKDNGKLCYIIPQTILTAGDLDVLRYHLAKFTTIEKIIIFNGRMFVGRGIRQNKAVPTSSLVFVATRRVPDRMHQVEIITYKDSNDTIEEVLQNILSGKKIKKKRIPQNKLFQSIANWNFIKQDKEFLDFHNTYQRNTEDMMVYYTHAMAEYKFKSRFYFDSGYGIDEKQRLNEAPKEDYYLYPKLKAYFWTIKEYRGFWPNIRKGTSPLVIKLRQANQGYNLLDSKYKIIWSYANPSKFHFTLKPVIWARNQICAIGSENRNELVYLFALLNSPVINAVLHSTLRSKSEKDLLVSTTAVKEFVRVPKITKHNQHIKEEVIKRTDEILALEERILSDFIDFSGVMMQKFDNIAVEENSLVLTYGDEKVKLKIKSNRTIVAKSVKEKFYSNKLIQEKQKISLSELKGLAVIDFGRQKELKEYIDDLVFALYFNINLWEPKISKADEVEKVCSESKFYTVLLK